MIDLTLLDTKMLKWRPSLIAASSIYLAKRILNRQYPWTQFLTDTTSYSERHMRDCAKEMCGLLTNIENKVVFAPVFKKFSSSKFLEVAKIVPPT